VTSMSISAGEPSVRRTSPSWPLLAWVTAYTGAILSTKIFGDPDSMWHVAAGRWMLEHREIVRADPFSHSMPGAPWIAHEWLSELLMVAVHGLGGWVGLHLFIAVVFATTVAAMLRFLLNALEPVAAITITALSAALMSTHLLVRPHVLAWPVLLVWFICLAKSSAARISPPWWLIGLMFLWVNLHGSFVFGMLFAAGFFAEAMWEMRRTGFDRRRAVRWSVFLVLVAAIGLLNPNGWRAYAHVFEVMGMRETLAMVSEWRSTNFHEPQLLLLWMLFVLMLAFTGRLRVPVVRGVLVFAVLYLALKHERYHSLLGLVTPVLLAPYLRNDRGQEVGSDADHATARLDALFRQLAMPSRWSIVVTVPLLMIVGSVAILPQWRTEPSAQISPVTALQHARARGITGPVLNAYNFGGFLIYQGIPVFVDGRADMYGDTFIRNMRDAIWLRTDQALPELLRRYRITWTMLQPTVPAVRLMDRLPGWERVYTDSVAVVHRRTMPTSSITARTKSIGRSLEPD